MARPAGTRPRVTHSRCCGILLRAPPRLGASSSPRRETRYTRRVPAIAALDAALRNGGLRQSPGRPAAVTDSVGDRGCAVGTAPRRRGRCRRPASAARPCGPRTRHGASSTWRPANCRAKRQPAAGAADARASLRRPPLEPRLRRAAVGSLPRARTSRPERYARARAARGRGVNRDTARSGARPSVFRLAAGSAQRLLVHRHAPVQAADDGEAEALPELLRLDVLVHHRQAQGAVAGAGEGRLGGRRRLLARSRGPDRLRGRGGGRSAPCAARGSRGTGRARPQARPPWRGTRTNTLRWLSTSASARSWMAASGPGGLPSVRAK